MDTSSELLAIAIGKVIGGGRGVPYEAVSLCQINGRVEREPEPEPGEHDFGFVAGHKP
ncbi:hypothetical protein ACIQTZ_22350 [Paenarthrobacter sp. NPDC090520]|uniref:hypothetical protein n=1 Tax=Paenarthrobacter sp. NPDC090520 TaxID=3364382 RepID=UPI003825257E